MLSKNSTFVMCALLLSSNAAVLFGNAQEEATTIKRAVRTVAVSEAVKAQVLGQQDTTEETEEVVEADEDVVSE